MHLLDDYLSKTESALNHLCNALDSYRQAIASVEVPVFVTSTPFGAKFDQEFQQWHADNSAKIAALSDTTKHYIAEGFSIDCLAGAVLQIAAKAFECFATGDRSAWPLNTLPNGTAVSFVHGRPVRGVPLGLVVYAGRNQHTHFNEARLHPINLEVFERLCRLPLTKGTDIFDPCFDLSAPERGSLANNVLHVLEWSNAADVQRCLRESIARPVQQLA